MTNKTDAVVNQPIQVSPDIPLQMGGGIAIAASVLTVLIQQGFNAFNRKEQHEAELVEKLIEGLQRSQEQLLTQQQQVTKQLEVAVNNLSIAVREALEKYDHHLIRLDLRLRSLERKDEEAKK